MGESESRAENTAGEEEFDTVRPEFAIPEEELCRKCGRKRIDRSKNLNSILCRNCREEQIRYPFPKMMIPIVIAAVLAIGLAMIRTPMALDCYKSFSQAERRAASGDIYPVLKSLMEVMDHYPDSVPVAERLMELSMDYGYYDLAIYSFNQYLAGREVGDSTYLKISSYMKKLDRIYNTTDQLESVIAAVNPDEQEIFPYDKVKDRLKDLLEDPSCEPALLYYYMANFTEDQEEAAGYLEKSVEADEHFHQSLVLQGTNRRRSGDLKGARECYDKVYSRDRHNADVMRALGILCLLEGEKERGLELVAGAYEEYPDLMYVKETLIIAWLENGDKEKAENLKAQFEAGGTVFDDDFKAYLNGDVSLHDYYIDVREGDL